jgi:hypothetical protein
MKKLPTTSNIACDTCYAPLVPIDLKKPKIISGFCLFRTEQTAAVSEPAKGVLTLPTVS